MEADYRRASLALDRPFPCIDFNATPDQIEILNATIVM